MTNITSQQEIIENSHKSGIKKSKDFKIIQCVFPFLGEEEKEEEKHCCQQISRLEISCEDATPFYSHWLGKHFKNHATLSFPFFVEAFAVSLPCLTYHIVFVLVVTFLLFFFLLPTTSELFGYCISLCIIVIIECRITYHKSVCGDVFDVEMFSTIRFPTDTHIHRKKAMKTSQLVLLIKVLSVTDKLTMWHKTKETRKLIRTWWVAKMCCQEIVSKWMCVRVCDGARSDYTQQNPFSKRKDETLKFSRRRRSMDCVCVCEVLENWPRS